MNNDRSNNSLRVAVVGDYQIGKSSLVNCLLSESLAETGERFDPTTERAAEYVFAPGVLLVDTPGFNDTRRELTEMTKAEIARAEAVLFIKTDKTLGDRNILTFRSATRKPMIVLFNCWEMTLGTRGFDPKLALNVKNCASIKSQLDKEGLLTSVLAIDGHFVTPVTNSLIIVFTHAA